MTIFEPIIFKEKINMETRIFGIDPGTKTIGVAVGDIGNKIATPVSVIKRKKFTLDMLHLEKLIKEYEVGALIIGLPLNMDGSEGKRCQSVRDFTAELNRFFDNKYPISFHDERLSTHTAETFLIEQADLSRKKRAGVIDKMAAQNILQGALDSL